MNLGSVIGSFSYRILSFSDASWLADNLFSLFTMISLRCICTISVGTRIGVDHQVVRCVSDESNKWINYSLQNVQVSKNDLE